MRNLIFAINITLDGCVDHTKQVADDETHEYFMKRGKDHDKDSGIEFVGRGGGFCCS